MVPFSRPKTVKSITFTINCNFFSAERLITYATSSGRESVAEHSGRLLAEWISRDTSVFGAHTYVEETLDKPCASSSRHAAWANAS